MRALRALVGKEWLQHRGALLGITVLLAIAWAAAAASASQEARVLTAFELVARFAGWPLLGAALYLGHRLVVVEYFGRTQRFVEALPVPRGRMVVVKAALGLACLLVWALVPLAIAAYRASASEAVDNRFLALLAARLGGHVFALWGVVFLLGLFGRLRIPFGAALAAALFALDHYTRFQLSSFGPFALISSQTFGLERTAIPHRALAEALIIGAAALVGAWAMARAREGSFVEKLARPLSPRELGALAVLGVAALDAAVRAGEDARPEPFALTTDAKLTSGAGVEIGYFADDTADAARRVMVELEPTVRAFGRALGLEGQLPRLWLVHAADVPRGETETQLVHRDEGVVLRANLIASTGDALDQVIAEALHQLLWARTDAQAADESTHWILDGFTLHFARHGRAPAAPPFGASIDPVLAGALAVAGSVPAGAGALIAYHTTAERVSEQAATTFAASAIHALESRVGRGRVLELARATLTRIPSRDIRDVMHRRLHPMPRVFADTVGLSFDAFATDWAAALERTRPSAAAALAAVPRGGFEVRVGPPLAIRGALSEPPATPLLCTAAHARLPPHDQYVAEKLLVEETFTWEPGQRTLDRVLEVPIGSGERALVILECEAPVPAGVVRLLSRRVTVP